MPDSFMKYGRHFPHTKSEAGFIYETPELIHRLRTGLDE